MLAVAALGVALTATVVRGGEALSVALGGCLVAVAIYAASELATAFLPAGRPLERLLLGMTIRGFGALTAVTLAVAAGGIEGKTVALVALPLYAALLAGEVVSALGLSANQGGN